jgi:hypothetical protein
MQMTRFAMDATLPVLRPDSYAIRSGAGDQWWVYTPSSANPVLFFATEEEVKEEFGKIGVVKSRLGNTDSTSHHTMRYWIEGPIKDSEWWKHRAQDGMLGDLDLSQWGIAV